MAVLCRTISGTRYYLYDWFTYESGAQRLARQLRSTGHLVRVWPSYRPGSGKVYEVLVSRKKRRRKSG